MNRRQSRSTLMVSGKNIQIPKTVHNFYYSLGEWGFSVREQKHRQQIYWYAFKRINGVLHKRYISKREEISYSVLMAAAYHFQDLRLEARFA